MEISVKILAEQRLLVTTHDKDDSPCTTSLRKSPKRCLQLSVVKNSKLWEREELVPSYHIICKYPVFNKNKSYKETGLWSIQRGGMTETIREEVQILLLDKALNRWH